MASPTPTRDTAEVFRTVRTSRTLGEGTLSNFQTATEDAATKPSTQDDDEEQARKDTDLFQAMQEQKRKENEKKAIEEDEERKRILEEDARWTTEVEMTKREKDKLMKQRENEERELFRKERLRLIQERQRNVEPIDKVNSSDALDAESISGVKRGMFSEPQRPTKKRLVVVKKKGETEDNIGLEEQEQTKEIKEEQCKTQKNNENAGKEDKCSLNVLADYESSDDEATGDD